MIECRKYNIEDYTEIVEWWKARGVMIERDILPSTGFIVPGIAAGFLMKTDTAACIIEPFIANPRADKQQRDRALNFIIQLLVAEASQSGFKRIFGFSSRESMIERVLDHGFVIVEESTTVVKELK